MCQVALTRDELREGMSGKLTKNVEYGQCSEWVAVLGCRGMMQNGNVQVIRID